MTPVRTLTLGCLFGWLLAGCVAGGAEHELPMPSRARFTPVSEMLHERCGALTCHGAQGRNLRLYGAYGRRLAPSAFPGDGSATSAEEHDANYASVITLEPELLSEVYLAGGADPERLSLVRKARGQEAHKGTGLLRPGDAADRCLLAWLRGQRDDEACLEGSTLPRPGR